MNHAGALAELIQAWHSKMGLYRTVTSRLSTGFRRRTWREMATDIVALACQEASMPLGE
jgi:hypothetical protein